jgi:hypothetical protein
VRAGLVNWKDTTSREWMRTFAIITTDANELVAEIHDRMPLILSPTDYPRWLSDEPDPGDLMRPFPAEPMRMWPIIDQFPYRPLCVILMGLRVAEIHQHAIVHVLGHEPAEAFHSLRDAFLICGNDLA